MTKQVVSFLLGVYGGGIVGFVFALGLELYIKARDVQMPELQEFFYSLANLEFGISVLVLLITVFLFCLLWKKEIAEMSSKNGHPSIPAASRRGIRGRHRGVFSGSRDGSAVTV